VQSTIFSKIVTLWSHLFAPLLKIAPTSPDDKDFVSIHVACVLAISKYPALISWPKDLQALANLFQENISAEDVGNYVLLAKPLMERTAKKMFESIVSKIDNVSKDWTLPIEWQTEIALGAEYWKIRGDPVNLSFNMADKISRGK